MSSVWSRTQLLPQEVLLQIQAIYSDNFPIEVRHFLAPWIEEAMRNYGGGENMMDQSQNGMAQVFLERLIAEIDRKVKSMERDPQMCFNRSKLSEAAENLARRYSNNPWQLVSCIQQCLMKEQELLRNAGNFIGEGMLIAETKYSELLDGLSGLRASVDAIHEQIGLIDTQQQSFALKCNEYAHRKGTLRNYLASNVASEETRRIEIATMTKLEALKQWLNSTITENGKAQVILANSLTQNIENLEELQRKIVDGELNRWKREQQLHGNTVDMKAAPALNTIQDLCENLAGLIWQTWQQVKDLTRVGSKEFFIVKTLPEGLEKMEKHLQNMLSTLVKSTFLIEKQPPQVLKTQTKFTATVRLLVGGKLSVYMNKPNVEVKIISESQAQALVKSEAEGVTKLPTQGCGPLLNKDISMDYNTATNQMSATFSNLNLKTIKRSEKKGTDSVTEEKLALLFTSEFKVGGGEMTFKVWTLSLPVVVTVHGNQEPQALATVIWYNAFAAPDSLPFTVPDKVTWGQLAEMLNFKFAAATGRKLTDQNLLFLAEKLFNKSLTHLSDGELNSMLVSRSQFCKDHLLGREFTFWEWLLAIMKVTKVHLKGPWCDGLILGFIHKEQAMLLLSECPKGTFLMRFSDSTLGSITIAFVQKIINAIPDIQSVIPFDTKDLALIPLAGRIKDPQLTHLYREDGLHLDKTKAFKPYETSTPAGKDNRTVDGYYKGEIMFRIATAPPTKSRDNSGFGGDFFAGKVEDEEMYMNELSSSPGSYEYCDNVDTELLDQFGYNDLLDGSLAQGQDFSMPAMVDSQNPFMNGLSGNGIPQTTERMATLPPIHTMFPLQGMQPAATNMASPEDIISIDDLVLTDPDYYIDRL